jgi:hypothetical protein
MGIEETVNKDGQKQIINNFDGVIKIGNKFLQVRIIKTKKFNQEKFTWEMPRAKFIDKPKEFGYFITRKDIIKLKGGKNG